MKPAGSLACAIYTRKSTAEGLEQDFNSLDAQREACEAYVRSQAHEGWRCRPDRYDDGGFSGGAMDRPALQRLITDIAAGRVDVVVVYKVDRLTRSLADFARLVALFDARGVSFVSVTQSFNTTTSMGRLTLNILLSFAQFEREVTAERIRDKIAASKRKGLRVGGPVPLGYVVKDKALVLDPEEAAHVRFIFERYLALGCLTALAADLAERGIRTKVRHLKDGRTRGGIPFTKGPLAYLLRNPVYVGDVVHKGTVHRGQHPPILERALFDAVQARLAANAASRSRSVVGSDARLLGRLFDDRGNRMTPTHSNKRGVRYRYYVSCVLAQGRKDEAGSVPRVPAPEIEQAVLDALARRQSPTPASDPGPRDPLAPVERVVVHAGHLEIRLSQGDGASGPVNVPFTSPRRPRRAILAAPDDARPRPIRAETRARLVERIALARTWCDELVSGKVPDTAAIARREGCSERTVRMTLTLAFLSPRIVEAAIAGTLPERCGLTTLRNAPLDWKHQLPS
jgi:DNA invertase Pin-like site-specific DNA recombinase